MGMKTIKLQRYDPALGVLRPEEFQVPATLDSVLDALDYVHQHLDHSLQFRCGCAGVATPRCGFCGVMVDGKPKLACKAKLRSGMTIAPLPQPGPLRDLVVDHGYAFRRVRELGLYSSLSPEAWPPTIVEPRGHQQLMACTDCLCCLATCPSYSTGGSLGGPFEFVKLAQLSLHPREAVDRLAQTVSLGIERCESCRACYCVIGVPIVKQAIVPLLKAARGGIRAVSGA